MHTTNLQQRHERLCNVIPELTIRLEIDRKQILELAQLTQSAPVSIISEIVPFVFPYLRRNVLTSIVEMCFDRMIYKHPRYDSGINLSLEPLLRFRSLSLSDSPQETIDKFFPIELS